MTNEELWYFPFSFHSSLPPSAAYFSAFQLPRFSAGGDSRPLPANFKPQSGDLTF
ncbi:MAG: hypothetical protein IKR48_07965 [Kiritimatiellae bacterium]|nr:hypothetical protein [Kiritimatiellia bacterium]